MSRLQKAAGLFCLCAIGGGGHLGGDPLDHWHQRNPLPVTTLLSSVAYGNGTFLALGLDGNVTTSTDGTNWVMYNMALTNGDYGGSVAFGNGQFVVVTGWTNIWTTPDGVTWQSHGVDMGVPFNGGPGRIVYAHGLFVAIGAQGLMMTSPDGLQWNVQRVGQAVSLGDVAYGNGMFVAVGDSNQAGDSVFTSPDGNIWAAEDSGGAKYLGSIAYGHGQFVAVRTRAAAGFGKVSYVFTSPDGHTWTSQDPPTLGFNVEWGRIAFLNGQFLAPGDFWAPDGVTYLGNLAVSPDGDNWTFQTIADRHSTFFEMVCGNGLCVAVGQTYWASSGGLTAGAIFSSLDGTGWTRRDSGFHEALESVVYGNGQFVAVGSRFNTNGTILTSTNGLSWTKQVSGTTNQLLQIVQGAGQFVILGANLRSAPQTPLFLTSSNATEWTRRDPGTTNRLTALTYGNGQFVAIGGDTAVTSTDGQSWRASPPTDNGLKTCRGIAFGNGTFVAVGDQDYSDPKYLDRIFTSTDGAHWAQQTAGGARSLRYLAFGNGTFVALETDGTRGLTSPDGTNWTAWTFDFTAVGGSATHTLLTFGNGLFATSAWGVSPSPTLIYTSRDGLSWDAYNPKVTQMLFGIAAGQGTYVAVGDYGVIVQSDRLSGQGVAPVLGVPRWLGANGVEFTLSGELGARLRIDSSLDLNRWDALTNLTLPTSPFSWRDESATNASRKFYRALAPSTPPP